MTSPNTLSVRAARQQRLLDTSMDALVKQAGPSVDEENGKCLYRGPEGRGCAAAPFIADYAPTMEGKSWQSLVSIFPGRLDPAAVEEVAFVNLLQRRIHDVNRRSTGDVFLSRVAQDVKEQMLSRYPHLTMPASLAPYLDKEPQQ